MKMTKKSDLPLQDSLLNLIGFAFSIFIKLFVIFKNITFNLKNIENVFFSYFCFSPKIICH